MVSCNIKGELAVPKGTDVKRKGTVRVIRPQETDEISVVFMQSDMKKGFFNICG